MTKLFNDSKKPEVYALANLRNFFRKRKQDSRLQVAESIISDLRLKCDPLPLCEWLDAEKATQDATTAEKPAAAKKGNKLPVDTMTGSTAAKAELMPVIDTDQPVIVTSAQNNTANTPVFKQLQALAEHLNAKLIVLPVYYNRTAFEVGEESESESFNTQVQPYLLESDSWLYERGQVKLCAEAAVLPTAKLPINAAEQLNRGELFTVIGSPKQQFKCIPTLIKNRTPKAWTTGTCTAFNYKRGRAGTEAEAQHIFGGTLFVRDDSGAVNSTNIRQGDDGTIFLYLAETGEQIVINSQGDEVVSGSPETMGDRYGQPATKLGDLHCEMSDPIQWQKALDFVADIKPLFVACDDILHFSTRGHHQRNDSKHLYATRNERVENDLLQVINQLNELAEIAPVYVTESNHNSSLDIWLSDTSVKIDYDAHNAKIYHLIKWLVMDTLDDGVTNKNALQVALENADLTKLPAISDRVEFGRMDVPKHGYKYDFSQHGHKGQSGSAGNPKQLAKLNLFLVSGHTHSPCILGTQFVTGVTASLNQGYNRGGASGWDHAHVMEHPNGECQLINTNPQV